MRRGAAGLYGEAGRSSKEEKQTEYTLLLQSKLSVFIRECLQYRVHLV